MTATESAPQRRKSLGEVTANMICCVIKKTSAINWKDTPTLDCRVDVQCQVSLLLAQRQSRGHVKNDEGKTGWGNSFMLWWKTRVSIETSFALLLLLQTTQFCCFCWNLTDKKSAERKLRHFYRGQRVRYHCKNVRCATKRLRNKIRLDGLQIFRS